MEWLGYQGISISKFLCVFFFVSSIVLFTGIVGSVLTFSPLISVLLIVSASCSALFNLVRESVHIQRQFNRLRNGDNNQRKEAAKVELWQHIVHIFRFVVPPVSMVVFAFYPLPLLAFLIGIVFIMTTVVENMFVSVMEAKSDGKSMLRQAVEMFQSLVLVFNMPIVMFVESTLMGSHAWGLALFIVSCCVVGWFFISSLFDQYQGPDRQNQNRETNVLSTSSGGEGERSGLSGRKHQPYQHYPSVQREQRNETLSEDDSEIAGINFTTGN